MATKKSSAEKAGTKRTAKAAPATTPPPPSWIALEEPAVPTLKVYVLDPSASNYVGNVMSVNVKWEKDLKPII